MRATFTKIVASSVHVLSLGMELGTYYRYYYSSSRTFTLECLLMVIVCVFLDVLIFRAHWSMANDDPGYLNDSPSVVAASELAP